MIALSFTRAELARHCKFAFNQRYILKTPEAESPALQGGGYFHDLTHQYGVHLSQNNHGGQDAEKALSMVVANVPEGVTYEVYNDIADLFVGWANRTVLQFPDKSRFETRLAFNQAWEPVDWMAEDVFLRMMIDRIDFVTDPIKIVDYKTSRALQEAKKLQQRTYAFGANLALGDKRQDFLVVEEFVRFGAFREEVLTYDEYGNVGDYYLKLAQEIEQWTDEMMQPAVGVCDWCGLCGYKDLCPKYKLEIADTDLDVRGMEDAAKLAEKVYVDEARNKLAKDVLKVFAEENGAIAFGDQEYGPVVGESVKWPDLEATVEALRKKGVATYDIMRAMSLSRTGLDKVLKTIGPKEDMDAVAEEIIQEHGQTKPSQRFTFHKATKEE